MAQGQSTVTDPACRACRGQWPARDHFIAELDLSSVYLHDDQFFPGWTVLVFKRHATELFHLAATERVQLMEEVARVSRLLADCYGARKMNYELLGNQIPHMHWHVIPRLPGDPAPLEPVWRVTHEPVRLAAGDLSERIRTLRTRLS